MFDIEFYEDINGKSDTLEYLESLQKSKSKDDRVKANKIRMYMRLLKEYGLSLNEPYIKKLDGEIWELRPLKDRILFAKTNKNKIVLLNCFRKQSTKTPEKEIEKAKIYLEDYKKRSESNE